jgi:hypothetical protein
MRKIAGMAKTALRTKASVGRAKKVKTKPVVDLTVNKDSAAFKVVVEAHAKGRRVSTKGMTREQFIKTFLTK